MGGENLAVVQITEDNNVGARVAGQEGVHQVLDGLRLGNPLGFGSQHRWLDEAKERVVATEKVYYVVGHCPTYRIRVTRRRHATEL